MNYTEEATITKKQIIINNYLPNIGISNVREEIIRGLKSFPKYISPKFFYDKKGSELFESITELEEYYPSRTEKQILSNIGNEIDLDISYNNIIELGSGDHSKIRLLFNQIPLNSLSTIKYYPIDISKSAIESSANALFKEFPMISINGIVVDFLHHLNMLPKSSKSLFCFFGSTIGNLNKTEIKDFMTMLGSVMKSGDKLLMGMDMIKDITVLEDAYNDKQDITADFNKNILNVMNSLINADFNTEDFEHFAFYNRDIDRIEMHLTAKRDLSITINEGSEIINFLKGETIHTENSHKFNNANIETIASWADLKTEKIITDKKEWFSEAYFKKI